MQAEQQKEFIHHFMWAGQPSPGKQGPIMHIADLEDKNHSKHPPFSFIQLSMQIMMSSAVEYLIELVGIICPGCPNSFSIRPNSFSLLTGGEG